MTPAVALVIENKFWIKLLPSPACEKLATGPSLAYWRLRAANWSALEKPNYSPGGSRNIWAPRAWDLGAALVWRCLRSKRLRRQGPASSPCCTKGTCGQWILGTFSTDEVLVNKIETCFQLFFVNNQLMF